MQVAERGAVMKLKLYRDIVRIPDVEGISLREMENPEYGNGTYVWYAFSHHVQKPAPHDEKQEVVIGKVLKYFVNKGSELPLSQRFMYPTGDYYRLFTRITFSLDALAFPDSYDVEMGCFIFLRKLMKKCGLWDLLEDCFGDRAAAVADLAMCLVNASVSGDTPDRYADNYPLISDDGPGSDHLIENARKISTAEMHKFVKRWAERRKMEDRSGVKDGMDDRICLFTDLSLWHKLNGSVYSGYTMRLKEDIRGPRGIIPVANYVIGIRMSDGMPVFYKDFGMGVDKKFFNGDGNASVATQEEAGENTTADAFGESASDGTDASDESAGEAGDAAADAVLSAFADTPTDAPTDAPGDEVDINCKAASKAMSAYMYEESLKLCAKYSILEPSFILKPSDVEYGAKDIMDSHMYDYICEMKDLDVYGYQYVDRVKGTFEGDWRKLAFRDYRTYFGPAFGTYSAQDVRDGTICVYYEQFDEAEYGNPLREAEREIKSQLDKAERQTGKEIQTGDLSGCSCLDLEIETRDGKQYLKGYSLNEEKAERMCGLAGYSCIYSTSGSEMKYARELFAYAEFLGVLIESDTLNRHSFNASGFSYGEKRNKSERESWKTHNHEVESFIKFIACILWQETNIMMDNCRYINDEFHKFDAYDVLDQLGMMTATCTRKGKAVLQVPMTLLQKAFFRTVGLSLKDIKQEMLVEAKRFIDRQML